MSNDVTRVLHLNQNHEQYNFPDEPTTPMTRLHGSTMHSRPYMYSYPVADELSNAL